MKNRIFIVLGLLILTGLCATAQSNNEVDIETDENVKLEIITPAEPVTETKQEIKEREKRLRQFNDDVAYAKAYNSLRRGYFVLLADNIQIGNMGYRHYDINENSNFILVQGDEGIIQFALNSGHPGPNGLGGWTGKGKVLNKRMECNKKGDVYYQFDLSSTRFNVTVNITLYHNGKRAVAQVSGGPNLTIYGEILPYRDRKK